VNAEDVERMARKVNLQRHRFLTRFTKSYSRRPGWWLLRNTPGTEVRTSVRACSSNSAVALHTAPSLVIILKCADLPRAFAGLHLSGGWNSLQGL
jgi:hypothetical protein